MDHMPIVVFYQLLLINIITTDRLEKQVVYNLNCPTSIIPQMQRWVLTLAYWGPSPAARRSRALSRYHVRGVLCVMYSKTMYLAVVAFLAPRKWGL